LVAPYTAVGTLFVVHLLTRSGNVLLLNLTTTAVAVLVVLRQTLAAREKRELLERQRDDLVSSVSHELRTPLTGIQGYAQILSESWQLLADDERQEMLETIDSQANHLGRIASDLIDVARDRLQNVQLKWSEFSASELVREAVAATGGEGKVMVEADPEARLWADEDRLRQVLVNLITNAMRYGGPNILVTVTREDGMVALAVHDDGDGVPVKFQSAMWGRFERGAHKDNSKVPGSGIGLSVAKDLVTAHGGTIGYRASERLGGACFELVMPASTEQTTSLVTAESAYSR
jgi:signal transduction histidine kinase